MNKSTIKFLIMFAIFAVLALFVVGVVQSVIINNLEAKKTQTQIELEETKQKQERILEEEYVEAIMRERGALKENEKIFQSSLE